MFNISVLINFKIAGRAFNHLLVKQQEKHCFGNSKFALNEKGEVLPKNIKIAKTVNFYFQLITDCLELFD